ncbi:MAG TPA: hypothetical protein VH854_02530 [Thermoanaerobaculia bacterium]|jgi:hypothetical protein|nr:hypothetical protein [Thermoanaerobaculia bacterium]
MTHRPGWKSARTAAAVVAVALTAALLRCASAPASANAGAAPEPITPADLVASIADVAAGRNAAMAEAGLVLKKIEFHLAVGREVKGGGSIEILLLDAEAARSSETSFVQDFTLEIPAAHSGRGVAERPLVPGVRDFVDAAMNTARDLARAASDAGLPQRLHTVELTAKITRSKKYGAGITATIPAWVRPSVGAEAGTSREDENTVKMFFEAK